MPSHVVHDRVAHDYLKDAGPKYRDILKAFGMNPSQAAQGSPESEQRWKTADLFVTGPLVGHKLCILAHVTCLRVFHEVKAGYAVGLEVERVVG